MSEQEVSSPRWHTCAICGLWRLGDPPHGQNTPCPEYIRLNTATVEMLDAQKAHYLGSGMAMNDMGATIRKMMGKTFGDDDDQ